MTIETEVLIIGSGAGGSVTALTLAQAGRDVLVVEEGARHDVSEYGQGVDEGMRRLYRRRGMTPIFGSIPIGYVEGRCLGGSTEINSGFWHRTPPEILMRWQAQFDLADASAAELEPDFRWAENLVSVGLHPGPRPASTAVFERGIARMGWSAMEVPRMVSKCDCRMACASGCPTGGKQSMSRSLLPRAEAAGARVLTGCRVRHVSGRDRRITGVTATIRSDDGHEQTARIEAAHVFVCAGPTETPALLRRSGIRRHVGSTLALHPMLKVAARFRDAVHASAAPPPLVQVKEFWPEVSLGGAYMSPGMLAMHLSENWPQLSDRMADVERIAMFYVAVRGTGRGAVRTSRFDDGGARPSYELSSEDHLNLSRGTARLSALLLEAGADEVYPCVQGLPTIRTSLESIRWLDERLPRHGLSLTTVHAFSSCPIGEREERTAADSFGRVHGYDNLYVNDASMLPDSPGVNPQGSVMGLARRNARHFHESAR